MKSERNAAQRQLIGWKAIGRHVGRSQRATQLWEVERGLPIHRLPGGPGQSVFAYVDEIDAWMHGAPPLHDAAVIATGPVVAATPALTLAVVSIERATRPPGILVMPFEMRGDAQGHGVPDALCQQLIGRLSAVQPVRVLSWTTSRTVHNSLDPLDAIAARLHVRYLVEGSIEHVAGTLGVDVRVVDAELDQVMLADRFVIPGCAPAAAQDQVAEGVALHFALIHEGALVEPMCLTGVTPSAFLDYLEGARFFFEDPDGTSGRSLASLDRALSRDPAFVPARTLRGLALLRAADGGLDGNLTAEACSIASACGAETSARVTTAFLHAAIERTRRCPEANGERPSPQALRWIPPSIASQGRLYERRSPLRPRTKDHAAIVDSPATEQREMDRGKPRGQRLFDEWLQTIVASHRRGDEHRLPFARPDNVTSVGLDGN